MEFGLSYEKNPADEMVVQSPQAKIFLSADSLSYFAALWTKEQKGLMWCKLLYRFFFFLFFFY